MGSGILSNEAMALQETTERLFATAREIAATVQTIQELSAQNIERVTAMRRIAEGRPELLPLVNLLLQELGMATQATTAQVPVQSKKLRTPKAPKLPLTVRGEHTARILIGAFGDETCEYPQTWEAMLACTFGDKWGMNQFSSLAGSDHHNVNVTFAENLVKPTPVDLTRIKGTSVIKRHLLLALYNLGWIAEHGLDLNDPKTANHELRDLYETLGFGNPERRASIERAIANLR